MRKIQIGLLTLLLLILFIPANKIEAATVDDIRFYVEIFYYGEQPENLQKLQTIKEITDALDEYSRYMTADEYKAYKFNDILAAHLGPVANITEPERVEANVESALLYGNIGYMKITHFATNLQREVVKHWTELKKRGATELIIDLRYNGGGYVKSAEQFLGFFQGAPAAYRLSTRETESFIQSSFATTKFIKNPYILVNRYSASASEIVAVSLQDQKAATIVGGQTKGKGTVQSLFEFDDGSALKLTTGMFRGPEGTLVQEVGVIPDIQTEPGRELVTTHKQLLTEQLTRKNYTEIEHTTNGTTIELQLPYKMNFLGSHPSYKVQLIELGDKQVSTKLAQTTDRQTLTLTPDKMLSNMESIVVIEPTMERLNGKRTRAKMYATITPNTNKQ